MAAASSVARPRRRSRFSSGALPLLLLAAGLVGLGAAAAWYENSLEVTAKALAEEIAASVVPDEALVPSTVKTARAENAALAAALAPRFTPRAEPVTALRVIEAAGKANGVASSFQSVEVLGWDGSPARFGGFDAATATSAPYAAVAVSVEAHGSWAEALTLAADIETLPLASRVDSLRLSSAAGDPRGAWVLTAALAVAAK